MINKIHHIDCGSFCPHMGHQLFGVDHFCCHCLLIETNERLILIDTGLSELYLKQNSQFYKKFFHNPSFQPEQSAVKQVKKLGYRPEDVTDIIATHLDQDHVGGIPDFRNACVHIHINEKKYLNSGYDDKLKRFSNTYFKYGQAIVTYNEFGENWNGFKSVRMFNHIEENIFLIPLVGHTDGHCGIAVDAGSKWIFHAGDAYLIKEDLSTDILQKNMKSELFQSIFSEHNKHRLENQKKLAQLQIQNPNVLLINSHDPRYLID